MTPKFRAYDADDKVMRSWEEIDFTKDIGDDYYMVGYKASPVLVKYDHEQILMQYTGLKDKDGVEIYEGDILEVEKNKDGTYKGTINGNTFFDRFQGYSSKIKVDGMHDIKTIRYWNNHVRIIGNIYENPDLYAELKE